MDPVRKLGLRLFSDLNCLRKRYGRSGEYEMRLVNRFVPRGSTAFDVGANKGVYARIMATRAGRVVAFEPLPTLHDYLRAVLPGNCELVPAAVGAEPGRATIRVPLREGRAEHPQASLRERADGDSGPVAAEFEVEVTTLDAHADGPVSFVKVDVEGFEPEVLAGARRLIERDRPNFLIELEERHRPGVIAEVGDTMTAAGYRGFFYFRGRPLPIGEFRPELHQNLELFREGAPRATQPYVNNFFFVHPVGPGPSAPISG